jgi:hypothetical protein
MEEAGAYWNEHQPPSADKLAEALEQKTHALVDEDTKMISVHRILRGMRDITNML